MEVAIQGAFDGIVVQDGNTTRTAAHAAREQEISMILKRNPAGSIQPQTQRLWGIPIGEVPPSPDSAWILGWARCCI